MKSTSSILNTLVADTIIPKWRVLKFRKDIYNPKLLRYLEYANKRGHIHYLPSWLRGFIDIADTARMYCQENEKFLSQMFSCHNGGHVIPFDDTFSSGTTTAIGVKILEYCGFQLSHIHPSCAIFDDK